LTHEWAREDFVPMVVLQSIGQAFSLLPLIINLLSNSNPARATAFAAYIQLARLGGAEIGVSLMGTWLRVREQIHSNYIGQYLANGSAHVARILQQLTGSFASHGATAPARALDTLSALVARESNVEAYIDGFWLTFWLAMLALGLTALITRAPAGPFAPKPFRVTRRVLHWFKGSEKGFRPSS